MGASAGVLIRRQLTRMTKWLVMRFSRADGESIVKTAAAAMLYVFAFVGSRDGVVPRLIHLRHSETNLEPLLLLAINVVLLPLGIGFLLRLVQRWSSNTPALIGGLAVSLASPLLDTVSLEWFATSLLSAIPVVLAVAAAAWFGSWLASRMSIARSQT